jgi:ComF family protein
MLRGAAAMIRRAARAFAAALYPADIKCAACGGELDGEYEFSLCPKCAADVVRIRHACPTCGAEMGEVGGFCRLCLRGKRQFITARAPYLYGGTVRKLLIALKNGDGWVADYLSAMLTASYPYSDTEFDCAVCVPVEARRGRERGYNQAELLAHAVCTARNIPFIANGLIKTRTTLKQALTRGAERAANVRGAYAVNPACRSPDGTHFSFNAKNILLIDDILTTGSTANECAAALNTQNPASVRVLTLAAGKGV